MIDYVHAGCVNGIREPDVAHEMLKVLLRVEFAAFRRQRDEADIFRHFYLVDHMPSRLIVQQLGFAPWRDGKQYLCTVSALVSVLQSS
jgi:hypothetical protein